MPQEDETLSLELSDYLAFCAIELSKVPARIAISDTVSDGEVAHVFLMHGLPDALCMVIKRTLEPVRESAEVHGLEAFVETHDPKFPTLPIDLVVEEVEVDAEARLDNHRSRLRVSKNALWPLGWIEARHYELQLWRRSQQPRSGVSSPPARGLSQRANAPPLLVG